MVNSVQMFKYNFDIQYELLSLFIFTFIIKKILCICNKKITFLKLVYEK